MNNVIYPCIWFNNNGTEAAGFYCGIFPNTTYTGGNGMVQMLSINGQSLMFLTAGPMFAPNASVSFLIANEDEKETERLYNRLAEGGIALMPLDSYPFSRRTWGQRASARAAASQPDSSSQRVVRCVQVPRITG